LEQIQTLLMINGIYSHIKIDKIDDNNTIFELSTSLNKKLIEILQNLNFLKIFQKNQNFLLIIMVFGKIRIFKSAKNQNTQIYFNLNRLRLLHPKLLNIMDLCMIFRFQKQKIL